MVSRQFRVLETVGSSPAASTILGGFDRKNRKGFSCGFLNLSFICALVCLLSTLSFTITKKFKNGFDFKFEMKGMDFMRCICIWVIGILGGTATTVFAGDCSLVT